MLTPSFFLFLFISSQRRSDKVARNYGDDAIVAEGVTAGEKLVTDGQLQLEDGTIVEVNSVPEKKSPPTYLSARKKNLATISAIARCSLRKPSKCLRAS